MTENPSDRERQVAWRLTQLAILAFITIFVFSMTDDDSNKVSIQLPDATLQENETANTSSDPSGELLATTSSTLENNQVFRSFTFVATGELLIHEFVADAANSYG